MDKSVERIGMEEVQEESSWTTVVRHTSVVKTHKIRKGEKTNVLQTAANKTKKDKRNKNKEPVSKTSSEKRSSKKESNTTTKSVTTETISDKSPDDILKEILPRYNSPAEHRRMTVIAPSEVPNTVEPMSTPKTKTIKYHEVKICEKIPVEAKNTSKKKTELCRNIVEKGRCPYGKSCHFAHSQEELKVLIKAPTFKSLICAYCHAHGICYYGDRCSYSHASTPETVGSVIAQNIDWVDVRQHRTRLPVFESMSVPTKNTVEEDNSLIDLYCTEINYYISGVQEVQQPKAVITVARVAKELVRKQEPRVQVGGSSVI